MPTRPPRAKPKLLPAAIRRHQAKGSRPSSHALGYDCRWRKLARLFLMEHPICFDPFGDHAPGIKASAQVDHIIPKSRGGTDDWSNLAALCLPCHSRKTALFDGGFGRTKKKCRVTGTPARPFAVRADGSGVAVALGAERWVDDIQNSSTAENGGLNTHCGMASRNGLNNESGRECCAAGTANIGECHHVSTMTGRPVSKGCTLIPGAYVQGHAQFRGF